MSYWDEHEPLPGKYNFDALDKQITQITKAKGVISLCLGVRQPRWPENHWPEWACNLPKPERSAVLLQYIEQVVRRYKDNEHIVSWQLENEALLTNFGERPDTDRQRLQGEYILVKRIDPKRPIIMTTSTSWGIPIRSPRPDIVGFSFYQIVYSKGKYSMSLHKPWLDRLRARAIKILWRKPSFIHELQLEPWGPQNIWEMTVEEQDKSMSISQLRKNIQLAKSTNLYPIDLWGSEWWYWQYTKNDPTYAETISHVLYH